MATDAELNEQVARRLGWRKHKVSPKLHFNVVTGHSCSDLPNYVGDIGAAWEVWEHIAHKTDWAITIETNGNEYECWLSHSTERQIIVQADTGPRAICKVFLKLTEGQTE